MEIKQDKNGNITLQEHYKIKTKQWKYKNKNGQIKNNTGHYITLNPTILTIFPESYAYIKKIRPDTIQIHTTPQQDTTKRKLQNTTRNSKTLYLKKEWIQDHTHLTLTIHTQNKQIIITGKLTP